jgi:hypothetical protein
MMMMMTMSVEQSVEWELAEETETLGENLPQCHFAHHKFHMVWPGVEPGPMANILLTAWAMVQHMNLVFLHCLTSLGISAFYLGAGGWNLCKGYPNAVSSFFCPTSPPPWEVGHMGVETLFHADLRADGRPVTRLNPYCTVRCIC